MRALSLLALASLLLVGCQSKPSAPEGPSAEELSRQYSPGAQTEDPEPASEARTSRMAEKPMTNTEPVEWDGKTAGFLCVRMPTGCLGVVRGADEGRRGFELPRHTWLMTVTITWDAVDESTKELSIHHGTENVTGPSPLTMSVRTWSDRDGVQIKAVYDGSVLQAVPEQPFHGRAEFST